MRKNLKQLICRACTCDMRPFDDTIPTWLKPDPSANNRVVLHMTLSGDSMSACWTLDPSAQPFEFKAGFRASLIGHNSIGLSERF